MDNLQIALQPAERRTTVDSAAAEQATAPPCATNRTTKADLLTRARIAVDAGSQSLHDAAGALGLAKEEHSASQREMAEAVGRSPAWVNALLKWRLSHYNDTSPFDRPRSRSAAKRSSAGASEPTTADADDARQEAETEIAASTNAEPSISRKPSPAEAKGNLVYAINAWWRHMDAAGKHEVIDYFLEKAGLPRAS